MTKTIIENLVFEGGGTKGAAYAGCMEVMEDLGLLSQIKQVAGTSAGSITSLLLACGSGSAGLTEAIDDTNFQSFIYDRGGDLCEIWRAYFHYGLHTGDPFVKTMKSYIKKYAGDEEITFAQLDELIAQKPETFKKLTVVASNLTTQVPEKFNSEKTPDVPLWKAVRASMSIPLIFEPMNIDGNLYVDGGVSWNYPIDIFDTVILDENGDETYDRNPATLGFFLEPQKLFEKDHQYYPTDDKITSLKTFAIAMLDFALDNANSKNLHPDDKARTVFIDDLGVSGTSFTTSPEMIQKLIISGKTATQAYFAK